MLALEVELLTGRYVATAYNDRERAEWPPHPARLYAALVATWAEDEKDAVEAQALEWLADQPPPRVLACRAFERTINPVFVPVNDIQTVRQPLSARAAIDEAETAVFVATPGSKTAARAEAALAKAHDRLRADTQKAISTPTKERAADVLEGLRIMPDTRLRQPRTFPSVTPVEPRFSVVWDTDPPTHLRAALRALCGRLVRLGHSSSLVRARLTEETGGDGYVPHDDGTEVLRVPRPGQLAALVRAFEAHGEVDPRVLPCGFARYSISATRETEDVPNSVFGDDLIVFARRAGDRFAMTATADVAGAMRGALLKHADVPIPSLLSGHDGDGTATRAPHVAVVPLPFVGSAHADGQLMGVAIVIPRAAGDADRNAVHRAIAHWEASVGTASSAAFEDGPSLRVVLGSQGAMEISRVVFGQPLRTTLRSSTWCRPSRRWATATPIALDRNPGDLSAAGPDARKRAYLEAEECIRLACERIGLPRPVEVDALRSVVLAGSEKPRHFPPFPRDRHKTRRVLVHACLVFEQRVRGPVLLGAGRFLGLGLCRPLDDGPEGRR